MDQRPIGVFDSGLGGLTAVRELTKVLPGEDVVYFGDTGRVPYGSRSKETIIKYARQDVAFLRTFDLKAVIIACGTVSTTSLDVLKEECPVPIWGVVESAAQAAAEVTKNGKIGLIGTEASIRSGRYEAEIAQRAPEARVYAQACPLFVPMVENGRFRPGDAVIEIVADEYLHSLRSQGVDTLVLGCTHYPLLADVIGAYMGPDVALIDTGAKCVHQVAAELKAWDALADPTRQGECRFYVSDRVEGFSRLASIFLSRDVTERVEQVDILKY